MVTAAAEGVKCVYLLVMMWGDLCLEHLVFPILTNKVIKPGIKMGERGGGKLFAEFTPFYK